MVLLSFLLSTALLGTGCADEVRSPPQVVEDASAPRTPPQVVEDASAPRTLDVASLPSPVIAAAGDISCAGCAQMKTAALLDTLRVSRPLAAVLPLGDDAYGAGRLSEFQANYAPSWGRPELLAITHPVPGNHEYVPVTKGTGYFAFFNGDAPVGIAGATGQGYYSFDLGSWHLVALNSNDGCRAVSCAAGSDQQTWLAADLASHPARCTLAFWHNPRFQGGLESGETEKVGPLWDTLYDYGADVVLNGHEHNYQQLAPLDKSGASDQLRGIRSFVVGTGGAGFHEIFGGPRDWAVETRIVRTHGVLELTLQSDHYDWRFVTVNGVVPPGASGSEACH